MVVADLLEQPSRLDLLLLIVPGLLALVNSSLVPLSSY
jgi:hypothetical protein